MSSFSIWNLSPASIQHNPRSEPKDSLRDEPRTTQAAYRTRSSSISCHDPQTSSSRASARVRCSELIDEIGDVGGGIQTARLILGSCKHIPSSRQFLDNGPHLCGGWLSRHSLRRFHSRSVVHVVPAPQEQQSPLILKHPLVLSQRKLSSEKHRHRGREHRIVTDGTSSPCWSAPPWCRTSSRQS